MVVLIDGADGRLAVVRPSWRDRALARMFAARCDQRLADGERPERDLRLALRAQRLVRADTRRWLARSLQRLLAEANAPRRLGGAPALTPECRRRLVESSAAVHQVIHDLERSAPLAGQGVAALCVLLRDGRGPLYGRASAPELQDRLDEVQRELLPLRMW